MSAVPEEETEQEQMTLFEIDAAHIPGDQPGDQTGDQSGDQPASGSTGRSVTSMALERAELDAQDYLDEYPDMFDPRVPGTRFHEIPENHPKPKPMTPYRDAAGRPVSAMFDGAEVPNAEMRRELVKIREREEERQYHKHITRGMVLHTIREIDAMESHARRDYLRVLESYDRLNGTGHVAAYSSHAVSCTWRDPVSGVRCHSERKSRFDVLCAGHTRTKDLNWNNPVERQELDNRKIQAKTRMTSLLEMATNKLVDILEADDESLSPAVRLQAIQTVFDRGGLPKETQTNIEATVEHTDNTAASEAIRERLAGLAAGMSGVFAQRQPEEIVVDAEVVSDN